MVYHKRYGGPNKDQVYHISTRGGSAVMIMQIASSHIQPALSSLRIMFSPFSFSLFPQEGKKGQPIMEIIQSRHFSST